MVGTRVLGRLDDRQTPSLLARRQHVHPSALQHMVFGQVVDVAVERHRVGHAEPLRVVDAAARRHHPPPTMSRCRPGIPCAAAPRRRPARPRSACAAPAATAPTTRGAAERGPDSDCVGASSRPLRTTAIRSLATPRATRSRADGSDTVTYWLRRCSRGDSLDSTYQPIRPSTGPATGHCSRWQWCTSTTTRRPYTRRARNGKPFWVSMTTSGSHSPQRSETDARRSHRQQRPDVHRVAAAGAVDPHTVDDFAPRRTRVAGGAQRDRDPRCGQLRADALQIGLAAAALRVSGVAPAQQQDRAQSRHRSTA